MVEGGGRGGVSGTNGSEIDDLDPDDLELEIELRSPRDVADRLIVLGAVCRRAVLELGSAEEIEEPETERFDLLAWLRAEGLAGAISAEERRVLETRVGDAREEDTAEASWRAEALVALAWAGGLVAAIGPYDEPADPQAALALIPSPWDKTGAFRAALRLRSEEEIAAELERAELWHWRVRTAVRARHGDAAERAELDEIVREVAGAATHAGFLPRLIDGDFPIRGRPYRVLDEDGVEAVGEIAYQRHYALSWVCGNGEGWDDVPTDT